MYGLKENGKVFTSKFVGTGPSSYEKRIYRAAVSQRLRNTGIESRLQPGWSGGRVPVGSRGFILFQNVQTGSGAHPASYSMGTGVKQCLTSHYAFLPIN